MKFKRLVILSPIAPNKFPVIPSGELANELRAITETESLEGLKSKIVETGGMTIKTLVKISGWLFKQRLPRMFRNQMWWR